MTRLITIGGKLEAILVFFTLFLLSALLCGLYVFA